MQLTKRERRALRDELWQLFLCYCEQQDIDAELRMTYNGAGALFFPATTGSIVCWHTLLEGMIALKSLLSGKDEWIAGVEHERFQQEYPAAYDLFLMTAYRIPHGDATDLSFCYREGEVIQVIITGWRQHALSI